MKVVFADTFYFLALLNPRDEAHERAVELSLAIGATLVTTEFVLLEVADALAAPAERQKFIRLMEQLDTSPSASVVRCDPSLFRRGVDLYVLRPDKDWPLTDCISFVVMQERQAQEALTGDIHFRQAGFIPLLAK